MTYQNSCSISLFSKERLIRFFQYFYFILELYQTDKKKIYILTDTYNAKFGTLLKEKNAILSVIQLVYTVMQNTLKLATY